MKPIAIFSIAAWLSLSVQGCFICEEGNGRLTTDKRKAAGFIYVDINMDAQVTLRQSKSYSVTVEAEENLQEYIRTRVRGKTLIVETTRCIRPENEVHIEISMPEVEEIELSGSGTIRIPDTIHVQTLQMKVNGSGDIDARLTAASLYSIINGSGNIALTGSANQNEIKINGSGNVNARDLPSNRSNIKVNGSGDVYVYVIRDMDVNINGSGSVYYRGKPAMNTRINGSGKVVDKN